MHAHGRWAGQGPSQLNAPGSRHPAGWAGAASQPLAHSSELSSAPRVLTLMATTLAAPPSDLQREGQGEEREQGSRGGGAGVNGV